MIDGEGYHGVIIGDLSRTAQTGGCSVIAAGGGSSATPLFL